MPAPPPSPRVVTTDVDPSPPANAKLTRGPVAGHVIGQTLPMVFGVAAMMSIALIDTYFIGQLGSDPLAAIAFIFPVMVALNSLGIGVMVGINSVVARSIGEGDEHLAQRRANFGILFSVAIGIAIGLAVFAFNDPIFRLMNAPERLIPIISEYMIPFAFGFPLTMLVMGCNGVLRAQGEARKTSYVSFAFAGVNWVLDPILITGAFGFEGLGIIGAAYATIIGWGVGAIVAMILLRSSAIPFSPSVGLSGSLIDPARAILKVALPASFSNSINPIGLAVLTAIVALESDAAVAGFGAAGRLQSIASVPLLALSGSIGAIVGQNWGAREFQRARDAALYARGFCVLWGMSTAVLLFFTGGWFAGFFTQDPSVTAEFELYIQIAAWGYAGFGLLIVANGILNAVDKASVALTQSVLRVFLVMLPFALLLNQEWGSSAIYGAELAANLFGGLTGIALVWWVLSRAAKG